MLQQPFRIRTAMPDFDLPDGPPSARLLPEADLRGRRAQLEWLHDKA